MEPNNIKKYISVGGTPIEIGDLYGGGPEEVVTSMEEIGKMLRVWTGIGYYDLPLQTGDYLSLVDGSSKIVKSNSKYE